MFSKNAVKEIAWLILFGIIAVACMVGAVISGVLALIGLAIGMPTWAIIAPGVAIPILVIMFIIYKLNT